MSSNNKKKNKEKVVKDKRALSLKLFSVFSIIILIVIAIVFNVLFDSILGNKLKVDFTATEQNTLSQQSIDYINSLPEDTYIRIVGLLDRPSNDAFGYSYIVPLLDDYEAKSNGRIVVEYKNPESYPSIYAELDPSNTHNLTTLNGQYVIKVGDSIQTVSPMDCFEYDENYLQIGQYVFTKNITESAFTSAIFNATNHSDVKAYYITDNSGESHAKLEAVLNGMGIESEGLQISTNFVFPADCDLLFISNINTDITPDMAIAITDYLSKGGKLIVTLGFDSGMGQEPFVNVNAVLDYMNLMLPLSLIQDNSSQYIINSFDSHIVPTTDFASFTNAATCIGSTMRQVKNSDNNKSYIVTASVLTTSSLATLVTVDGDTTVTNNDATTYYAGMYSTYQGMNNPPEAYVFGSATFTSDAYISAKGMNDSNVVFLRSCIESLLNSKIEKLNTITIEGKNIADYSIDPQKATLSTVNTIMVIFMVIIPLAFVVVAVVVFKKRKNL